MEDSELEALAGTAATDEAARKRYLSELAERAAKSPDAAPRWLAERVRLKELPEDLLALAAAAGHAAALAALGRTAAPVPERLEEWYLGLVPGDRPGAVGPVDVRNAAGLATLLLLTARAGELVPGDADVAKLLKRATKLGERAVKNGGADTGAMIQAFERIAKLGGPLGDLALVFSLVLEELAEPGASRGEQVAVALDGAAQLVGAEAVRAAVSEAVCALALAPRP